MRCRCFSCFLAPACGRSRSFRGAPNEEERVHFFCRWRLPHFSRFRRSHALRVFSPPPLSTHGSRGDDGDTAAVAGPTTIPPFPRRLLAERFTPQKRWWPVQRERERRDEERGRRPREREQRRPRRRELRWDGTEGAATAAATQEGASRRSECRELAVRGGGRRDCPRRRRSTIRVQQQR